MADMWWFGAQLDRIAFFLKKQHVTFFKAEWLLNVQLAASLSQLSRKFLATQLGKEQEMKQLTVACFMLVCINQNK